MTKRSEERVQFLKDLIVTAVEGGINYWAEVSGYDPDAGTVTVYDDQPDGAGSGLCCPCKDQADYNEADAECKGHAIDIDDIARGVNAWLKDWKANVVDKHPSMEHKAYKRYVTANKDNDGGEFDAADADSVVQFALFGTAVFG